MSFGFSKEINAPSNSSRTKTSSEKSDRSGTYSTKLAAYSMTWYSTDGEERRGVEGISALVVSFCFVNIQGSSVGTDTTDPNLFEPSISQPLSVHLQVDLTAFYKLHAAARLPIDSYTFAWVRRMINVGVNTAGSVKYTIRKRLGAELPLDLGLSTHCRLNSL